ncbi:MAG: hypothetical protein M1821_009320 [Bathelium mastoideum]|nr:MAG: hypothetical protein M1821_009320 [Bathelium mastoideum]
MPIGALDALSIASAVVQLVDFTAKLVSRGYKLHHATEGTLLEWTDLDASARKMVQLNNAVIDTFDSASKERDIYQSGGSIPIDSELNLRQVCKGCSEAAEKLVRALERLKSSGSRSKWQSFRQALKSIWGKSLVDALRVELDNHRNTLDTTLLVSLRYNLEDVKKALRSKTEHPTWQAKIVQDITAKDWKDNKAGDIYDFGIRLSQAAASVTKQQLELQILMQLSFRDRSDRHDRIAKAGANTFQWIYASQAALHGRKFSSFADWLKSNGKLYWITGKPGSGKSTLMKFINTDARTPQCLRAWSGGLPLITATFYFWNSGSESQMSQVGMLRGILYEALSQRPSLVSSAFPERWATSQHIGEDVHPWSISELLHAFDVLMEHSADAYKICLFIDGLDECSDSHDDLVSLITQYLPFQNVKFCLGSRPWPIFEDAFAQRPNLMLQDLTFDDIIRFANSKLCNSRGFQSLAACEPGYASRLTYRIAQKACGVFLWTSLVVDSLLTGLSNCDRISDLEKRLEETPDDLEELYEKMLKSIEKFYAGHVSQIFQLVREGNGNMTALMLSFADEEDENIAFKTLTNPIANGEKSMRYEIVKKRLNSRSKGFLEIPTEVASSISEEGMPSLGESMSANCTSYGHSNIPSDYSIFPQQDVTETQANDDSLAGPKQEKKVGLTDLTIDPVAVSLAKIARSVRKDVTGTQVSDIDIRHAAETRDIPQIRDPWPVSPADRKVTYLHRTARDFLQKPEVWSSILADSPEGFNSQKILMKSYILNLKTMNQSEENTTGITDCIYQILQYASSVEQRFGTTLFAELDETMRVATSYCQSIEMRSAEQDAMMTETRLRGQSGFLTYAAKFGLQIFIQEKLENGISIFPGQGPQSILYHSVADYKTYASLSERSGDVHQNPVPDLAFIRRRLNLGEDPNDAYNGKSPWEIAIQEACEIASKDDLSRKVRQSLLSHWSIIVEEFIKHGANPYANRNSPNGNAIRAAFGLDLPLRAKELEILLNRSQRRWNRLGKFLALKQSSKASTVAIPLFRLKQLENAQIPGHSFSEHYTDRDGDCSPKRSNPISNFKSWR